MTTEPDAGDFRLAAGQPGRGCWRIGLALSGGGFRASLFHLGVIRRLEELGIMPRVSAISCVSGGSIIGVYYVRQMHKRLGGWNAPVEKRLELFEEITADFFKALDQNLRTRSMIFSPFYSPLATLKSLRPGYSRMEVLQSAYDRYFFGQELLSDLPAGADPEHEESDPAVLGPRMIINTTSLLTGERVAFTRERIARLHEMKRVTQNSLPLAQVVGASTCVPGLMPPTQVLGDTLVDGGVSDNQGVEGLLIEGLGTVQGQPAKVDYDLMIVSDASGQITHLDSASRRSHRVLLRSSTVLQHQVRNKAIDQLLAWKCGAPLRAIVQDPAPPSDKEFAFFHLHLQLKGLVDGSRRVPSEYVEPLGRIRTDLDQFSPVEREALMYHGYTLVDAQLTRHCPKAIERVEAQRQWPALWRPPLFRPLGKDEEEKRADVVRKQRIIHHELRRGASASLLWRSVSKYPWMVIPLLLASLGLPLVLFFLLAYPPYEPSLNRLVEEQVVGYLEGLLPSWLLWTGRWLEGYARWPLTLRGLTWLLTFLLLTYLLAFVSFVLCRWALMHRDRREYETATGQRPGVRW